LPVVLCWLGDGSVKMSLSDAANKRQIFFIRLSSDVPRWIGVLKSQSRTLTRKPSANTVPISVSFSPDSYRPNFSVPTHHRAHRRAAWPASWLGSEGATGESLGSWAADLGSIWLGPFNGSISTSYPNIS